MKYLALTNNEIQVLHDAKKTLNAIAKKYCKARSKDLHPQSWKDGEEHRRMYKELKSLGIDVDIDNSADYEEAISLNLKTKTYLLQTEDF